LTIAAQRTIMASINEPEDDMRHLALFAPMSLLLLASAAWPQARVQLGNSVLCGPTEVIMPSQAVTSMMAIMDRQAYGRAVCEAVRGIDATGILEPLPIRIMLPIGEWPVRIRQNMR
jgi:hypothetical protein